MNESAVTIIAEAGVNHNGQRDLAFALVDAARQAGADAVKFQTFDARKLASKSAPKAEYQRHKTEAQQSQFEMLQKLELPRAWHVDLQRHAQQIGITFISTAFDIDSLHFLETLDLPFYKIPSGEITNARLLWHFARTGKKLVLSTGMATLSEIEQALTFLAHGMCFDQPPASAQAAWEVHATREAQALLHERVTLLHCTSQYPAPLNEVNLAAMQTLKHAFQLPVGYSDHTQGIAIPIAAAALGATVIEKHFTIDRTLPGPDHDASLEPDELKIMVSGIRQAHAALGFPSKGPQPSEWDTRKAARQVLVAATPIKAGELYSPDNLDTMRAARGLSAALYWDLIGQRAPRDYQPHESIDHG